LHDFAAEIEAPYQQKLNGGAFATPLGFYDFCSLKYFGCGLKVL